MLVSCAMRARIVSVCGQITLAKPIGAIPRGPERLRSNRSTACVRTETSRKVRGWSFRRARAVSFSSTANPFSAAAVQKIERHARNATSRAQVQIGNGVYAIQPHSFPVCHKTAAAPACSCRCADALRPADLESSRAPRSCPFPPRAASHEPGATRDDRSPCWGDAPMRISYFAILRRDYFGR